MLKDQVGCAELPGRIDVHVWKLLVGSCLKAPTNYDVRYPAFVFVKQSFRSVQQSGLIIAS